MRRHDWADRMFRVIEEHIRRPFAYAANDCSLFVARVVDAMTDSQHEQTLQSLYTDEETARAFIESNGGLASAITSFLGEPVQGRPMRGDVVLFDGGLDEAVGIWDGRQIVAMGELGLMKLPRREVKAVWRVA